MGLGDKIIDSLLVLAGFVKAFLTCPVSEVLLLLIV
jgi:hypothetical protein